jgi:hypothetical protein
MWVLVNAERKSKNIKTTKHAKNLFGHQSINQSYFVFNISLEWWKKTGKNIRNTIFTYLTYV